MLLLYEKLCLPLHPQQQQSEQCFAFVAKSYCSVVYSCLCECTGLLRTSAVQVPPANNGTSAAAGCPPALWHPVISFLTGKAQCGGAIKMQLSDAGSPRSFGCNFSSTGAQCSRKAKHRHCLGASPSRTPWCGCGWLVSHTLEEDWLTFPVSHFLVNPVKT